MPARATTRPSGDRCLAAHGIADGIMRRGHPRRPLTSADLARNRALVPIRAAIEPVFGTLKRSYD